MLLWTMSAIISYNDETWDTLEIGSHETGSFRTGPDISQFPEITDFLEKIGLSTKTTEPNPNVTKVVFRFYSLYANHTLQVLGGTEETEIITDNLDIMREQLSNNTTFSEYFMNTDLGEQLYLFRSSEAGALLAVNYDEDNYKKCTFAQTALVLGDIPDLSQSNAIAVYDGMIYQAVSRDRAEYNSEYAVKIIDPTDGMISYLDINDITLPGSITSMCWSNDDNALLVCMNNNIYMQQLDGTRTLYADDFNVSIIAYHDGRGLIGIESGTGNLISYQGPGQTPELIYELTDPDDNVMTNILSMSCVGTTTYVLYVNNDGDVVIGRPGGFIGRMEPVTIDMAARGISVISTDPVEYYNTTENNTDNKDAYSIYHSILDENGNRIDTKIIKMNVYNHEYSDAVYNPDDNHWYTIWGSGDRILHFKKTSNIDGTDTFINISDNLMPIYFRYSIANGGEDMFSGGNILNTNISTNINYTHSMGEYNTGLITAGDEYFGAGSKYFTDMYEGMFLMISKDINITDFYISGGLSSAGGRTKTSGSFTINAWDENFTVYYRQVFGASPASAISIIIIPENANVVHTASPNTAFEGNFLAGLSGTDRLYYLAISSRFTNIGREVPLEDLQAITDWFINSIDPTETIETTREYFTPEIVAEITALIPSYFVFDDLSDAVVSGGMPPSYYRLVYIGENQFLAKADDTLIGIDNTGNGDFIAVGSNISDINVLCYYNDIIYATVNTNYLITIDKNTGETLSELGQLHWPEITSLEPPQEVQSLVGTSDYGLLATIYQSLGETYITALVSINLETLELSYMDDTDISQGNHMITGPHIEIENVGSSYSEPLRFIGWFYNYDEETIYIGTNKVWWSIEPTVDNIDVQFKAHDTIEWTDVALTSIITDPDDPNRYLMFYVGTETYGLIRVKYKTDSTDTWAYMQED